MTTTIFYATQEMLDSLNTGTLNTPTSEATNLLAAVRGNIKSVQYGFNDIQLDSGYFSGSYVAVDPENSFIELMNGTKYYFNVFVNDGFEATASPAGFKVRSITMELQDDPSGSYNYIQWNANLGFVSSSLEIDAIGMNEFYEAAGTFSQGGWLELSPTPVEWSGGGSGGGGQPSGPGMYDGKVIMTAEADPTQVELLVDGQPLPTGSVVKVGSQKFFKTAGGSTAFMTIPQTPPAEWGWDPSANADWSVLQGF